MNLQYRLFELSRKHGGKGSPKAKHLRVFYGWAKINKTRKKEAISVIFENDSQNDERTMRSIRKFQNIVYVRRQTDDEKKDAEGSVRMFTEYSIFLSDRKIQGSLELALRENSKADKNNVSQEERTKIADALRYAYLQEHPDYREQPIQQELFD